jgi:hypothetical protein
LEANEDAIITALDQAHMIELRSSNGVSFDRKRLQLSPAKPVGHATARFGLLSWGEAQLVAADVENDLGWGSAMVSVHIAASMLVLCAGISGAFGALSRYVYLVRTTRLLPAWDKGRVKLGPRGPHALRYRLRRGPLSCGARWAASARAGSGGRHARRRTVLALALLLGVLGGFGGVVILGRLTERILPAPKPA